MKRFKPKKNLLREFIFNNEMKQASEQTVKSLLRSIVEPVVQSNCDGVVLVRIFDRTGLGGLFKRLEYSKAGVYFYSDTQEGSVNVAQDDIWETTEFAIVLAPRYCAALVWDYGVSEVKGYSNISFYLNSRKIQDILKIVIDNSRIDFMPDVEPYSLERRENALMCDALHKVVDCLNDAVLENHVITTTSVQEAPKPDVSEDVRKIIHEIRNNLSVIDLHSKIIEKRAQKIDSGAAEKILAAKAIVEKSTTAINLLLDELKGESDVKIENLNAAEIVEMALELAGPKLAKKNINVKPDLKNVIVLADETKALGVLLNVINNAIYALRENGKLTLKTEEDGDAVNIFVENDGEKIPDDIQKKIFNGGFTTKAGHGGCGLGLAISKHSMELMGGDLELIKSDEKSTIFGLRMKKGKKMTEALQ